jgi:hypothetical protein
MRAAPRDCSGERLVDGDRDAGYLAAIHAIESDEVARFVRDRDAHRHVYFPRLCCGALDQDLGFVK